jgi:integrase
VEVHGFDVACRVEHDDKLLARLRLVRRGDEGAFILDHEEGGSLWVHVNGDVAFLWFMATLVRPGLAGLRDWAILLLAFSLAARRSELVALDVEDLEECRRGFGSESARAKRTRKASGTSIQLHLAEARPQSRRLACHDTNGCDRHAHLLRSEGSPSHGDTAMTRRKGKSPASADGRTTWRFRPKSCGASGTVR